MADGASRKVVAAALGVDYKPVVRWGRAAQKPSGLDAHLRDHSTPAGPTPTYGGW